MLVLTAVAGIEVLDRLDLVAREDEIRWIHISYVPSDLRCQVIGENKA